MNIKALANTVTSKVGRQVLKTKKNSPTIMFVGGVVGFGATVFLASRATLKFDEVIEEHEVLMSRAKSAREIAPEDYSDKDLAAEKLKVYARTVAKMTKLYGPALLVGAASIGALTGSHVTLTRRNGALMAAYATLAKGMEEYRQRVIADVGEDKEREYRYPTEEKEIYSEGKKGEPKVERIKVASGTSMYAKFFDIDNENWNQSPEHCLHFIKMHQDFLNIKLNARGHVFLNEAYDALGMPRTKEGQIVGWVLDNPRGTGDNHIDFGIWDDSRVDRLLDFVNGHETGILVDFNVDGVVYDLI